MSITDTERQPRQEPLAQSTKQRPSPQIVDDCDPEDVLGNQLLPGVRLACSLKATAYQHSMLEQ